MKIEKYLVLNKYLLSLFGVNEFKELQEKLKDKPVDFDNNENSYFLQTLFFEFKNKKITEEEILRYNENIQDYVKKISFRRKPVLLKYFQYLAVLFTEIVLDNLKNNKNQFLAQLNEYLSEYKKENDIEIIDEFTEKDLNKLAFWMATGSGKTLIAHINYYQFFRYKLFSPDNILFITPNEALSKQHLEELQKSGIPCRLYIGNLTSSFTSENEVLVIEMTKFVEEKKGRGVTLPIETFEGKNLVFVDEGHKGKKSDEQKWAKLRNKLAENGFVFEYSATFGQILSEKNKETLKEYGKSIIFDYSYKYFYLDGYGKDFSILNANQIKVSEDKFQELMFIANLLSFYEQILVYEEKKELVEEYNLEKPLWIFVGTTVTGKKEESDVIQIVDFIKRVIQDEDWLKNTAEKILEGKTNLNDENGRDIFENKFRYLKEKSFNLNNLENLYKKVFGGKGSLKIYEIKNAQGEFGLKVGENEYFGVVNIGNVSEFKKQLENKGINVEQDVISSSLFDSIKRENSSINILIGSKKFIEGWDTWRVSSMGLLNIGKGQGAQIIQLFGRGVRLKGKDMSLKRSGNSEIQELETLNIYGIKADYLTKFLEAIRKEEVEFETIEIPVKTQHEEKWKDLYILTKNENKKFEEERILRLEIDDKIEVTLDLKPKLSIYLSKEETREEKRSITVATLQAKSEKEWLPFPEDKIGILDWDMIYQEINEYKILRGYWNLIIEKNKLKEIILSGKGKIQALPEIFDVKTKEDIKNLENIAILLIKKYIEKFYRRYANWFEMDNLRYDTADKHKKQLLSPFNSEIAERYIVQIRKENQKLIQEIKKLTRNLDKLFNEETKELPRVYFDKHLFLPLLIKSKEIDKITPEPLIESEVDFVKVLRDYLKNNKERFKDYELYLLRNFSKSGAGFQLQWSEFYPDFILWLKKGEKQMIVFIEPHGLEHSKNLNNEKIRFAKIDSDSEEITIKKIEEEINKKERKNVILEYFLLSSTSYENLIKGLSKPPKKEEYEENHVLFLNDKNWPEKLFKFLNSSFNGS
jgi:hypothetical protein